MPCVGQSTWLNGLTVRRIGRLILVVRSAESDILSSHVDEQETLGDRRLVEVAAAAHPVPDDRAGAFVHAGRPFLET